MLGPVDIYNEIFLTTLTGGNLIKQLRVEIIDGKDVEIPIVAGRVRPEQGENGDGSGVFVFAVAGTAPESAVTRLAGRSSAWIVLADGRDEASVGAARAQVEYVKNLGAAPLVVAAYSPVAGEGLGTDAVAAALGLGADAAVIPCRLRDRDSVLGVFNAAVERAHAEQDSAHPVS